MGSVFSAIKTRWDDGSAPFRGEYCPDPLAEMRRGNLGSLLRLGTRNWDIEIHKFRSLENGS